MKALAISALLALIGTTAAYRLFPKVDGLGKYPATISRGEAITRARQLAARYGRNVDGWTTWVDGNRDENTAEFLRTMSDHPLVRTTRPYKYVLVFTRGPFRVRVEMSGDGVPLEFSYRNGRRPEFSGQALTKEQEAGVLADFAGPDAGRFVQVSSVNRGAQGHLTTWEWKVEDQPDLIRQLEVTSSPDGIRRAAIRNEFSAAMLQRVAAAFVGSGFNAVVISVLLVMGITLTNALFFAGLARGQIKPGPALRMFAALMAIWAVGFWGSADLDGLLIGANAANQPPPEQLLRALGVAMATMGLFPAMWAVGRWLMRSAGLERWRTWDALLEGRVWRRAVGRSVACGFLLGVALLAIPMSLCAARIFARSETTLSSPASLAAGAPVALPLSFLMPWDLSGIFFLLVPLASMAYGRKWVPERLRWLLLSVLAVVLVAFVRKPVLDYGGNFVAAGILAAAFLAIYHWLDLLAVMMAEVGYSAALVAVYFLNQHSPAIQTNGIVIAAAYGMVALAGVAALLWAPELEAASEEAVVVIAAERDRKSVV